jgi:IS1 family transposase
MAFHILIEKLSETDSDATYRFYDSAFPNEDGELRLDKQTESISMTKNTREVFFARAARKVAVAYRSGNLPELLEWAS